MVWTPHITTLNACVELLCQRDNLADTAKAMGAVGEHVVTQLSYDSRTVEQGALFFCKGAHFDPEYLLQAERKGALAYVSELDYTEEFISTGTEPLPLLKVHNIRTAIADVAAYFYRNLLDNLTLIGFTGTKGKSTSTYMLTSILSSWLTEQGKPKSAWLSSIDNYDGEARMRSLLTTQETLELYTHFVNTVNNGIEYLTMEVSSQALKYARTRNLKFEVAGFLNIGEDHISPIEHPSHEDYLESKLKIFEQCKTAVVNLQTDALEQVRAAAEKAPQMLGFQLTDADGENSVFTHLSHSTPLAASTLSVDITPSSPSTPSSDVVASGIQATSQGLSFKVTTSSWSKPFSIPMAGSFNVENALAAITAALALGVPVEHMQKGLASCEVSGRMQLVAGPDDKLIIIDYAHNKLSFETLFDSVSKEYPRRPIVCVFGATGSKGTERRIEMPAVAAQYAQTIYITEDDPGEEPLARINKQIADVVAATGKEHYIIEDRDEAIRHAIEDSPKGSLVLVLGKGHETAMRRGRKAVTVPTDKERIEQILAALDT